MVSHSHQAAKEEKKDDDIESTLEFFPGLEKRKKKGRIKFIVFGHGGFGKKEIIGNLVTFVAISFNVVGCRPFRKYNKERGKRRLRRIR